MKILFENTTKYNTKIYDEFIKFHSNKFRFRYNSYTLIISVALLFLIATHIKHYNYNISIVLCIILTIFVLWRIFNPILKVQKEYNSDKIQKETKHTFKFYEDKFSVEDKKQIATSKYSKIYKIFETENFFYIYVDITHSLVLEKEKFVIGTSDEFSTFIKKKCWFKYKLVKKQK